MDIDERQRAEQALLQSQRRVQLIHELAGQISRNLPIEPLRWRTLDRLRERFPDLDVRLAPLRGDSVQLPPPRSGTRAAVGLPEAVDPAHGAEAAELLRRGLVVAQGLPGGVALAHRISSAGAAWARPYSSPCVAGRN